MSPSPVAVAWSIVRAMRVSRPRPSLGRRVSVDHRQLGKVLEALAAEGVPGLDRHHISEYRDTMETVDPDELDSNEALAYWLNVYNAGALDLAARAHARGEATVLRVPGAFDAPWIRVAGERLSLNDVEHGKVRRFGDPKIHGALVCGSASCPTLRLTPYGGGLDGELVGQMESFLRNGGAVRSGKRLLLSRIFRWYGGDFVRPHRMPTFIPARKQAIAAAIAPLLDYSIAGLEVEFQPYDWALSCSVG